MPTEMNRRTVLLRLHGGVLVRHARYGDADRADHAHSIDPRSDARTVRHASRSHLNTEPAEGGVRRGESGGNRVPRAAGVHIADLVCDPGVGCAQLEAERSVWTAGTFALTLIVNWKPPAARQARYEVRSWHSHAVGSSPRPDALLE